MKNLDNYEVVELSSKEMTDTQGGELLCLIAFCTCLLIGFLAGKDRE
jgi:hypothetical protein